MRLRNFAMATGLLLGSLSMMTGCEAKPAATEPAEEAPAATAAEGGEQATEPTTEPLGSG